MQQREHQQVRAMPISMRQTKLKWIMLLIASKWSDFVNLGSKCPRGVTLEDSPEKGVDNSVWAPFRTDSPERTNFYWMRMHDRGWWFTLWRLFSAIAQKSLHYLPPEEFILSPRRVYTISQKSLYYLLLSPASPSRWQFYFFPTSSINSSDRNGLTMRRQFRFDACHSIVWCHGRLLDYMKKEVRDERWWNRWRRSIQQCCHADL